MRKDAAFADSERIENFQCMRAVIVHGPRLAKLRALAHTDEIESRHAIILRKKPYLMVKTFFAREVTVQHDERLAFPFLQERNFLSSDDDLCPLPQLFLPLFERLFHDERILAVAVIARPHVAPDIPVFQI